MPKKMTSGAPRGHHYVPVFYLKNWIAAPERKLVEFKRREHGKITGRWTGPKGTAYGESIYDSLKDLAPSLETSYLQTVDAQAAVAIKTIMHPTLEWTGSSRSAWSRFLMSMLMRHPEDIETFRRTMEADWTELDDDMRHAYLKNRPLHQPDTADEWWEQNREAFKEGSTQATLQALMDNEGPGNAINSMHWSTVLTETSNHRLLSSDRPVLMTDTFDEPGALIIMPVSYKHLFIAVGRFETLMKIRMRTMDDLVSEVNRAVVGQAEELVFASDLSQTRFIQNHLGRARVRTLLHDLEDLRAEERWRLTSAKRGSAVG